MAAERREKESRERESEEQNRREQERAREVERGLEEQRKAQAEVVELRTKLEAAERDAVKRQAEVQQVAERAKQVAGAERVASTRPNLGQNGVRQVFACLR